MNKKHYTYIEFNCQNHEFKSTVVLNGYTIPTVVESVFVHGVEEGIQTVLVNGSAVDFIVHQTTMEIQNVSIDLNKAMTISWSPRTEQISENRTEIEVEAN